MKSIKLTENQLKGIITKVLNEEVSNEFSPKGYAKKVAKGDMDILDARKESEIPYHELADLIKKVNVKEQESEETSNDGGINLLASHLLFSQTQAHIFHLQTGSYAEHKALQGFYEGIDDLADSLIESYQGENENIMNYQTFDIQKYDGKESVIEYFESLMDIVNNNREGLPSHLQNIIDTINELITSTLYKLRKLS